MAKDEPIKSKALFNKVVITNKGYRLGDVDNIIFVVQTGELIKLVLTNQSAYAINLDFEKENGKSVIPYNTIINVGDYIIVDEQKLKEKIF